MEERRKREEEDARVRAMLDSEEEDSEYEDVVEDEEEPEPGRFPTCLLILITKF